MAKIRITDLHLRTIIGIFDWEREQKQDVLINIEMECDITKATQTDDIKDTVDYKTITKKIIQFVEQSQFFLLEKLTAEILGIVMEEQKVIKATVRIDKPQALRFAQSVSVEFTEQRKSK